MSDEIRIASPDDYQELFRISCLLHKENGQHEFSEEKSKRFIWRGCNQDMAIVGVIGPPHDLKAMIYLQIQPIYYSEEFQLGEAFAFVRPDCRRSDYAKRLIRFAKKCSEETGLDLMIGIISDVRLAAKARLYERELPRGGTFFNYRPKSKEKLNAADASEAEGSSALRSGNGSVHLVAAPDQGRVVANG
jgi:GNAT superfamily N-acetyltransferase